MVTFTDALRILLGGFLDDFPQLFSFKNVGVLVRSAHDGLFERIFSKDELVFALGRLGSCTECSRLEGIGVAFADGFLCAFFKR